MEIFFGTATTPSSALSSPAIMRKSVVFPAPFGPTRPARSPALSWNEASTKMTCRPYCLLTSEKEIMEQGPTGAGAAMFRLSRRDAALPQRDREFAGAPLDDAARGRAPSASLDEHRRFAAGAGDEAALRAAGIERGDVGAVRRRDGDRIAVDGERAQLVGRAAVDENPTGGDAVVGAGEVAEDVGLAGEDEAAELAFDRARDDVERIAEHRERRVDGAIVVRVGGEHHPAGGDAAAQAGEHEELHQVLAGKFAAVGEIENRTRRMCGHGRVDAALPRFLGECVADGLADLRDALRDRFVAHDLQHRARGGEREGFALEGHADAGARMVAHDLAPADERGERHAVAEGLAEAGEVGDDAEGLLCAAGSETQRGDDLVEDQQAAGVTRQFAHTLEVAGRRELALHRLHHDRGDAVIELRAQTLDVVVDEWANQLAQRVRNPFVDRIRRGKPVVKAGPAAVQHDVAAGDDPRQPHRGGEAVGAVLAEDDHLRARDHVDEELRDFDFERTDRRQQRAGVEELRANGGVDARLAVAEEIAAAAEPVDVAAAVRVDDLAAADRLRELRQQRVAEEERADVDRGRTPSEEPACAGSQSDGVAESQRDEYGAWRRFIQRVFRGSSRRARRPSSPSTPRCATRPSRTRSRRSGGGRRDARPRGPRSWPRARRRGGRRGGGRRTPAAGGGTRRPRRGRRGGPRRRRR